MWWPVFAYKCMHMWRGIGSDGLSEQVWQHAVRIEMGMLGATCFSFLRYTYCCVISKPIKWFDGLDDFYFIQDYVFVGHILLLSVMELNCSNMSIPLSVNRLFFGLMCHERFERCLFCLINGSKPKDAQCTMIIKQEKQQIFTFEKLEVENCWHFSVLFFFFFQMLDKGWFVVWRNGRVNCAHTF